MWNLSWITWHLCNAYMVRVITDPRWRGVSALGLCVGSFTSAKNPGDTFWSSSKLVNTLRFDAKSYIKVNWSEYNIFKKCPNFKPSHTKEEPPISHRGISLYSFLFLLFFVDCIAIICLIYWIFIILVLYPSIILYYYLYNINCHYLDIYILEFYSRYLLFFFY